MVKDRISLSIIDILWRLNLHSFCGDSGEFFCYNKNMYLGRGAGVILIDNKGRVLLQHRDKNASWYPNYWSNFGGQIEEGETPEQAIRREAKEEIGIELADLKFFKRYELKRKKGIYESFVFIASLNINIEKLKNQQKEGQGLRFFNSNELKNLKTTDFAKVALKDFFKQV